MLKAISITAIIAARLHAATEIPAGFFQGIGAWNSSGVNSGQGAMQFCDKGNTGTNITLQLSVVNAAVTKSGSTNVITNCSAPTQVVDLSGTFGSAVLGDGDQYYWTGKIISNTNPGAGDFLMPGAGYPSGTSTEERFPYKVSGGLVAPPWGMGTIYSGSRLPASSLGLIFITTDTYGTGTNSGTLVYSSAQVGTNVYDNGVVGYYGNKYSIPASHVCGANISQATGNLASGNATALVTCITSLLAAGVQAIGLGFTHPYVVNGPSYDLSMTGFVALKGTFPSAFSGTNYFCPSASCALSYTIENPFFQKVTATPYTDSGSRVVPVMMLVGQTNGGSDTHTGPFTDDFTTFKTMVDAAFTARDTNPSTGSCYSVYSSDSARHQQAQVLPVNETITNCTYVRLGTLASPTTPTTLNSANILTYSCAGSNFGASSSESYVAGAGMIWCITSTQGQLGGDPNQTSCGYYLSRGAVACYGGVVEPGGMLALKFPLPDVTAKCYVQGATSLQAMLCGTPGPWFHANLVGDPLAAPFTQTAPPVTNSTRFGPRTAFGPGGIF